MYLSHMPAVSLERYVVTLVLNQTQTEINVFSKSIITS